MSMQTVLFIGESNDPLLPTLHAAASRGGFSFHAISLYEAFASVGICIHQSALAVSARICCTGTSFSSNELRAVIVRPQQLWWPSTEFDYSDQFFIYHETMAAWFALLHALSCSVANKFDLSWWLKDENCHYELLASFCEAVGETVLRADTATALSPSSLLSVHVVNQTVISAHPENLAEQWVIDRLPEVTRWAKEKGLSLYRIDFVQETNGIRPIGCEPLPDLRIESPTTLERISNSLIGAIQ